MSLATLFKKLVPASGDAAKAVGEYAHSADDFLPPATLPDLNAQTSLNEWFANALGNPNNATMYNRPIGPSTPPIYLNGTRNPAYDEMFEDILPF